MVRRKQRCHRKKQHTSEDSEETLSENKIDESLKESFPASDPPSWAGFVQIGAPPK
jgi:hypothetical protein